MARKLSLLTIGITTACVASGLSAASENDTAEQEVVVTGTVSKTTTNLTSMAPVDSFSADRLYDTGFTDIARALETAEPELNFPRPVAQPTVSSTRPIFLNGLYPDEALVLVNGKRWHTSAVLDTNLGLGRGTASADLSTIPLSAIDHIEVLRDGASAQYGSDAIAGVINIILKSSASDGIASVQAGATERGDGANGLIAVNHGLRLGADGFLSLTAEVNGQESTDRSAIDQRYGIHTWHFGDPSIASYNLAANAAYPFSQIGELYGDVLVSRKDGADQPAYEIPGVSPLYPSGFLPKTTLILWDVNATLGLRGNLVEGFSYDLSNTYGRSSAAFYASNTANASLGAASPTVFYSGTPIYAQDITDLTFSRPLPIAAGGNLVAGAQMRYEHYQIRRGDPDSYAGSGAATLPGFNPRIPVDNSRTAAAGYVDLEISPLTWLVLGGAGRFDHYNDFGSASTYKFSTRITATRWLAFRGTAGTGFRAPSMQQEYYNTVSTTATGANKALVNVGTFQVDDPVAESLGATPLQAEKSHSYSFGVVLTPDPGLSVTGGLYRIDVDHRIALTDSQSGAAVTAALIAAGVTNVAQVAFFTNGISTRTEGGYATLSYKDQFNDATPYLLSIAYDRHHTDATSLETDPVVPSLTLLGLHSQTLLTQSQPNDKLTAAFTLFHGPFSGTADLTRYGGYTDLPISLPQYFGAKTLVDLSASAKVSEAATLTAGVLNVGDVFPDKANYVQSAYATFGNAFVYGVVAPNGTDGRAYYLRLTVRL
jgi:iron complex outermembrane receptor protein